LTLRNKIKKAASYKGADFFEAKTIAVIARGPSSGEVVFHKDEFNHCFLCGEFENTIDKIGEALVGKQIVLASWQNLRYKLSMGKCEKYGIKNIQVQYTANHDNFKKCQGYYKGLNVVPYTLEHKEIAEKVLGSSFGFATTGIGGILSSLYFFPRKIMIFGIDFYYTGEGNKGIYLCKENKDINLDINHKITLKSIERYRLKMINSINSTSRYYPDIKIEMYTTFPGIASKRNLTVHYV
jgi:hypothetical protein